MDLAIANPNTFYKNWTPGDDNWSSEKTIHDPCPAGYKVPSTTSWKTSNDDVYTGQDTWWGGTTDAEVNAAYYKYNHNPEIYYPFGYLKADDGKMLISQADKYLDGSYSGTIENFDFYPSVGDTRYVDPKFDLYYYKFMGASWSNDKATSLYYTYISPDYALVYGIQKYEKTGYLGMGREWKPYPDEVNEDRTDKVLSAFRPLVPREFDNAYTGLSAANGLQVRCVAE